MEIVGFVDEERLNVLALYQRWYVPVERYNGIGLREASFPRNVGCLLFLHCRQQPS